MDPETYGMLESVDRLIDEAILTFIESNVTLSMMDKVDPRLGAAVRDAPATRVKLATIADRISDFIGRQ